MSEVRAVFFASLRDVTERSDLKMHAASLGELDVLLAQHLSPHAYAALQADNVRIAINQTLLEAFDPAQVLNPGDEIAFLPPVTGG